MLTKQSGRNLGKRRGAVVVLACISIVALMSVLALSLDGGSLIQERRKAQAAVDAAALAAACDLYDNYWTYNGTDPSGTAKASALSAAKVNGYLNDGTDSIVTVNIPPKSGIYTGVRGYVEVLVEYRHRRGFSNIFTSGPIPVRARAVALGAPVAADVGILVLDPTSRAAFDAQGGGLTVVDGTPVVVNSTHSEGAMAGGGGSVEAQKFVFAGGYGTSGGGSFVGPIYTNRPAMPDPLADLPPPNPSSLTLQQQKKIQETSGNVYLQPGVYKGGVSVSGTANLYLAPGIYYMEKGGFSFSGQGSLEGKGVMIYTNPGSGNSDGISVTGQGSMILSGPTEGIYKGITFWQDRTSTVTGNVAGTGGKTDITGTFYFAGALLKISGNGGVANVGSQYISNQLSLGGNGGINIDWRPDTVAQKRSIYLVD